MTPDTTGAQLRTHVFTTPMHEFGSEGKHWSPCTSTLVTGETEAVLTDAGHIKSDVSAIGDMIEATGKRLTTIYITHAHLDHFLGIGQLMRRFRHTAGHGARSARGHQGVGHRPGEAVAAQVR